MWVYSVSNHNSGSEEVFRLRSYIRYTRSMPRVATFDSTTTVPQRNFSIQLQGITDYPIKKVAIVVIFTCRKRDSNAQCVTRTNRKCGDIMYSLHVSKHTVMHVASTKRNNYSLSINPQQINGNERPPVTLCFVEWTSQAPLHEKETSPTICFTEWNRNNRLMLRMYPIQLSTTLCR